MTKPVTATSFAGQSAGEILETLCPSGHAIEGVKVDQHWDLGATVIEFSDGSSIGIEGSDVSILGPMVSIAEAIIASAREQLADGDHLYHYKATAEDLEYAAERLGRELSADDLRELGREIDAEIDGEPTCECCECLRPCEPWGDGHACEEKICAHCDDDHDAAFDRAREDGLI